VLLAFVVIAVWENYNATETAIRNEAKAVGNMAQLSYALPDAQCPLLGVKRTWH